MIHFLLLLAAVAPYASADVKFTSPAAGGTATGGSTLSVQWEDSGTKPALSDLTTYQLFLCAGGNDQASNVRGSFPRRRTSRTVFRSPLISWWMAVTISSYCRQWTIQQRECSVRDSFYKRWRAGQKCIVRHVTYVEDSILNHLDLASLK